MGRFLLWMAGVLICVVFMIFFTMSPWRQNTQYQLPYQPENIATRDIGESYYFSEKEFYDQKIQRFEEAGTMVVQFKPAARNDLMRKFEENNLTVIVVVEFLNMAVCTWELDGLTVDKLKSFNNVEGIDFIVPNTPLPLKVNDSIDKE